MEDSAKSLNNYKLTENRSNMVEAHTPDWDEIDLEKCNKYDNAVKTGNMTYRSIEIN